jgi:hypothetical protein
MVSHLRRSLGLFILLGLGSGCYDATFREYPGKDAGSPDTRAKADARDSSRATPMDTKASPGSPDSRRG